MSIRRTLFVLALCSLFLTGCRGLCRRDPPRSYPPLPSGPSNIPPQNIPDGPPLPPTPRGSGAGAELLLPQPAPKSRSEYRTYPSDPYPVLPKAQPIQPRATITEPPPVRTQPPEPKAPVEERQPPREEARPTPKAAPPVADSAKGIEEFTSVKEGIAAGLRPTIEGLDWLQRQGYKTIIYLRRTDDDDTTDRRQVEKRDMKFVSLVVKPEDLNQTFLDDFAGNVGKLDDRPVFVYAREGNVSAAVWYMYLRTAEFLTHDEAKVRIARLGFKDDTNDYFKAALQFFGNP